MIDLNAEVEHAKCLDEFNSLNAKGILNLTKTETNRLRQLIKLLKFEE